MKISFTKILLSVFFVIACGGNVFTQSTDCGDKYFKHKSDAAIAAMPPEEKMDEMVLEQMFHVPSLSDDYRERLHLHIVNDGIETLPTAIKYINEFNHDIRECQERREARLLTAAEYMSIVDSAKFRVRAVENGRRAIIALEEAIERYRKSRSNVKYDGRGKLLLNLLEGVKGRAIKDGLIKHTLKKKYNINMSDAELTKFADFLIALDPAYPSWTSIFGWAEMTQAEADRYFQAYLKFKKTKRS